MAVVSEDDAGTKQALKEHIEGLQDKLIEEAQSKLDAVWDKIFQSAIMLCPIDTATLVGTIKIEKGYGATTEEGAFTDSFTSATAAGGSTKSVIVYDSTITAGDENKINPKTGQPCIYAGWVHDGHYSTTGKWVEGVPFLEMAIFENSAELDDALNAVFDAIDAE